MSDTIDPDTEDLLLRLRALVYRCPEVKPRLWALLNNGDSQALHLELFKRHLDRSGALGPDLSVDLDIADTRELLEERGLDYREVSKAWLSAGLVEGDSTGPGTTSRIDRRIVRVLRLKPSEAERDIAVEFCRKLHREILAEAEHYGKIHRTDKDRTFADVDYPWVRSLLERHGQVPKRIVAQWIADGIVKPDLSGAPGFKFCHGGKVFTLIRLTLPKVAQSG